MSPDPPPQKMRIARLWRWLRSRDRPRFNSSKRVLTADGRVNVLRFETHHFPWTDPYHQLLIMPWPVFLGLIGGLFVVANGLFAIAYLLGGDCIANANRDR